MKGDAAVLGGTTPTSDASRTLRLGVTVALFVAAAAGWLWSVRMVMSMERGMDMGMGVTVPMSLGPFLFGWLAMMVAMMFPAIAPVVRLYARAAAKDRVAPLPFFVAGYIAVWSAVGLPAYAAWRALAMPLDDGRAWAGRLAGGVLVAAAVWQLTPLKSVCLRHCRSPLSFFLRFGSSVERPLGALRMGATHGAFCLGCCWALMAILVAVGTMNLMWMAALALLILLEKNAAKGERIAQGGAVLFVLLGSVLLIHPATIGPLIP